VSIQKEAVKVMLLKYEICCGLLHGFDRSLWLKGKPQERVTLIPQAQEFILAQEDGKERFVAAVSDLSRAFALAGADEEALRIRDEVSFFQTVKVALVGPTLEKHRAEEDLNLAVRQIVSRAIVPEQQVLDVFTAAGLEKPDISILSDQFLDEVRELPQKNVAVELLRKLLSDEIKTRRRKNVVEARSFADMLEQAIRRYQNRSIESAAVIEELIDLAREMREADKRGEELGLSEAELAFYDALSVNDSAVEVLGDETLRGIAQELVVAVRKNVTIDWTIRENVRAQLRVIVKRILRKYGYPPDQQESATQTVLEQAAVLMDGEVENGAQ
jgi:type I restriction enzyme R subunit